MSSNSVDSELRQRDMNRLLAETFMGMLHNMTNGSFVQSNGTIQLEFDSIFQQVIEAAVIKLVSGNQVVQGIIQDTLIHSEVFSGAVYDEMIQPIKSNTNIFFLLVMGIFIFNMQAGFALLEVGCVRTKNITNSLLKNVTSCFVIAFAFWLIGMGVAFGETRDGAAGSTYYAFHNLQVATGQGVDWIFWFFQYVFCTTTTGILTGAIAERAQFISFVVYAFVCGCLTYPTAVHWCWNSEGWLRRGAEYTHNGETFRVGYEDFAGSGVVHTCGGISSLIAIIFLGPRIGRFGPGGKVNEIAPHSVTLIGLGGMGLFTGFIAFNAGSEMSLTSAGDSEPINRAAIGTVLTGTGGFLFVGIYERIFHGKWLFLPMVCGGLAGNVAACCCCAVIESWAALVIGAMAGAMFIFVAWLLKRLQIDDPVDAVPVHCGGGFTGVLALAFFKKDIGILYAWDQRSGLMLGWQLLGFIMIALWSIANGWVVCYFLKSFNMLRVDPEMELIGLDYAHGHEVPYPEEAYQKPNLHSGSGGGQCYHDPEDETLYEHLLLEEMSKYTTEEIRNPGWSHPIYKNRVIYDLGWISQIRRRRKFEFPKKDVQLQQVDQVFATNGSTNIITKRESNGSHTGRTQLAPIEDEGDYEYEEPVRVAPQRLSSSSISHREARV